MCCRCCGSTWVQALRKSAGGESFHEAKSALVVGLLGLWGRYNNVALDVITRPPPPRCPASLWLRQNPESEAARKKAEAD